ncbi:hypothetical protein Q7C36_012191 [Tachysurus vachellii]|uniref:Transmembrane protein 132C n=1 Tax=Tachysurus vachellii TaxID=175792 RepID=A0AA88MP15_TACVA|nr:hypothetical protein Q7C36_012191 [Tachysurus vachellii]
MTHASIRVEQVKLKDGVTFLGARPCNPMLWMISQDARVEGHRVVTLHCRKKESSYAQSVSVKELLISWMDYITHVSRCVSDTEILNTAVLNGRTVAVPVKVVTVAVDGTINDVSNEVQCRSTDEDVIKVSDRCDYVYVNGKEMKGRVRMLVNFTYSFATAQLEMNVWIPRLPLHIEVSDTELSPVKGWRIPTTTNMPRSVRDSDDEDDEERRGRTCTLQYQRAIIRILTHFVAESAEVPNQLTYMLGSDWQMDITGLVWDFLKVEDPRIARVQDGRLLEGVSTGMTSIQVLSPLSDSILAEKSVSVVDERVSITELGLQLVSGLALRLQLSAGSNQAISATATTQEVLNTPKQEALISAWLQFSDGSMAPLDLYDPDHFVLTVTSLDEEVVSVNQDATGRWPVVSAQAEGQGPLLRVEMNVHESCQKLKPRRSVLAAGNCHVRVKYGHTESVSQPEYGDDNENHRQNLNLPDRTGMEGHYFYSSISNMDEDGAMRRITTTTKTEIIRRTKGEKFSKDGSQISNLPIDFSDFPAQVDLPRGHSVYDDDLIQNNRGLSDLEIGMYALLGVFCLAILVFLINCISYALKYRHKEMSIEGQESLNHAHDWVWLGNEAELLESHVSLSPQTDEQITIMDSSIGGLEEGSLLLNGGSLQKNGHERPEHRGAENNGAKDGKGDSPTTKRKRVKFSTFTTIPASETDSEEPIEEIKWVCQDVDMGESKELQNYMERLNDSVLKDVA